MLLRRIFKPSRPLILFETETSGVNCAKVSVSELVSMHVVNEMIYQQEITDDTGRGVSATFRSIGLQLKSELGRDGEKWKMFRTELMNFWLLTQRDTTSEGSIDCVRVRLLVGRQQQKAQAVTWAACEIDRLARQLGSLALLRVTLLRVRKLPSRRASWRVAFSSAAKSSSPGAKAQEKASARRRSKEASSACAPKTPERARKARKAARKSSAVQTLLPEPWPPPAQRTDTASEPQSSQRSTFPGSAKARASSPPSKQARPPAASAKQAAPSLGGCSKPCSLATTSHSPRPFGLTLRSERASLRLSATSLSCSSRAASRRKQSSFGKRPRRSEPSTERSKEGARRPSGSRKTASACSSASARSISGPTASPHSSPSTDTQLRNAPTMQPMSQRVTVNDLMLLFKPLSSL